MAKLKTNLGIRFRGQPSMRVSEFIMGSNQPLNGSPLRVMQTDSSTSITAKGKLWALHQEKRATFLATPNTYFKYSHMYEDRYSPDSRNPTVIKMWKLQGAEPLVGIDQRYRFPYTREPVNFDLLAGKIVPAGGDIKISIRRSEGIVSERTLQDWAVQVEAVDGGLIKTDAMEGRVTYAAPENGYQPIDTMVMSTNPPHRWSGGIHQMYFMKSRRGQLYGKVNLSIGINQNPEDNLSVHFRGAANANGSRNFEADAPPPNPTAAK
jgi:hypothetical protein